MALLESKIPFGSPCLDSLTADKDLPMPLGIGATHKRWIRSSEGRFLTGGRNSGRTLTR